MGADVTVPWGFLIEKTKKGMNHTYPSGLFSYFHFESYILQELLRCPDSGFAQGYSPGSHCGFIPADRIQTQPTSEVSWW